MNRMGSNKNEEKKNILNLPITTGINNHLNNDSLLSFTHDTLRRESNNQIEIRSNLLFNQCIRILSNKSLIDC